MKDYEKETYEKLKKEGNLPQHLAVIMDGNGRWAKRRGKLRVFGHKNAIEAVRNLVESAFELNIDYLTLYAFSTENWKRPKAEVGMLMELFRATIDREINRLYENNIRFNVIGNISDFPKDIQKQLCMAVRETQSNTGMTLTLALSYGGQRDICNAISEIVEKIKNDEINASDINESLVKKHLYTRDLPQVDLLIRTSGEYRISNFMLWDIAYTELYFTKVLWPDFSKKDLLDALIDYQYRERRFGKINNKISVE